MGGLILCPCKTCNNCEWKSRYVFYNHLICKGFDQGYTKWKFHGERSSPSVSFDHGERSSPLVSDDDGESINYDIAMVDESNMHDNLEQLERDVMGQEGNNDNTNSHEDNDDVSDEEGVEDPSLDAKKFMKLIRDGQKDLYPNCKKSSKLSFLIRLLNIKGMTGCSTVTITLFLELLKSILPDGETLPKTYNEAMKIMKGLDLEYEKIDACPNDCVLYWGNDAATCCKICGALRDYLFSKTAEAMRWHEEGRTKDMKLKHPADSEAWKAFDSLFPDFAKDPRNVRLGLTTDGFNPFKTMSLSYSIWPIILIPYNLPPWMCMKSPYFMLSTLIPGPSSPLNSIDVYLQPLIKELKELWKFGVAIYDALSKQTFQMHAALMWTISDFLGYSMLSGWSTKGYLACPNCNNETSSIYLHHSRKNVYMKHRRFLDLNHPWQYDKKSFDGTIELGSPTRVTFRDYLNGRLDLQHWGIREELHPRPLPHDKILLPPVCFSMTSKEKGVLCDVLKGIKLPDSHVTNISTCVNVKKLLIRLSAFFRGIYAKVINLQEFELLEKEIAVVLCELERIFLPAFFDIMTHLPIHLASEAKFGGPVQFRCMYAIERYFLKMKSYVRNKNHLEGCIAEGYLADECINFCSRYLDDSTQTRFNRPSRNYDVAGMESQKSSLFTRMGRSIGNGEICTLDDNCRGQAHRCVLFNCPEIENYRREHEQLIMQRSSSRKWKKALGHSLEFHDWFETQRRKTQNSGVVVTSLTETYASSRDQNPIRGNVTYFGVLKEIIELDYYGHFNVLVFKCDWFQMKEDEFGFSLDNFKSGPRDLYDMSQPNEDDPWKIYDEPNVSSDLIINECDDNEINSEVNHFDRQSSTSLVNDNSENEGIFTKKSRGHAKGIDKDFEVQHFVYQKSPSLVYDDFENEDMDFSIKENNRPTISLHSHELSKHKLHQQPHIYHSQLSKQPHFQKHSSSSKEQYFEERAVDIYGYGSQESPSLVDVVSESEDFCTKKEMIVEEQRRVYGRSPSLVNSNSRNEGFFTKKTRGTTKALRIQGVTKDNRIFIQLNTRNQPIGPTHEAVNNLSTYLGTLARNAVMAPLVYHDWRKVPRSKKIDMLDLVYGRFEIDECASNWILSTIGTDWRNYKCRLKRNYYCKYKTDAERLKHCPAGVPFKDWKELVLFWSSKEGKVRSLRGIIVRKKQQCVHTTGSMSFARVREKELEYKRQLSLSSENSEDLETQNGIFAQVMGIAENARKIAMDVMKDVKDKLEDEIQKKLQQHVQSIKAEVTDQVQMIKVAISQQFNLLMSQMQKLSRKMGGDRQKMNKRRRKRTKKRKGREGKRKKKLV
ncbi:Transposon, En/Spm-like protein [Corchorus capsularis]|uniref:Transposon, En/Spm-like protein n=1 Tax=Corchorus capsularis TaxID=210143 RepID=A0A1R3GXT3_COCAP|nr:Transposon, En/Spm-like protein [Corchorus capsularis]